MTATYLIVYLGVILFALTMILLVLAKVHKSLVELNKSQNDFAEKHFQTMYLVIKQLTKR